MKEGISEDREKQFVLHEDTCFTSNELAHKLIPQLWTQNCTTSKPYTLPL